MELVFVLLFKEDIDVGIYVLTIFMVLAQSYIDPLMIDRLIIYFFSKDLQRPEEN